MIVGVHMIYVIEESFDKRLDLIVVLTNLYEKSDLIIWLYPESELNQLLGTELHSANEINAEPVTTYQKGIIQKCSSRFEVEKELINKIREGKAVFERNCDSLCLYHPGSDSWFACIIGHEGMCLIKDISLMNELRRLGFNTSLEPPSWW